MHSYVQFSYMRVRIKVGEFLKSLSENKRTRAGFLSDLWVASLSHS